MKLDPYIIQNIRKNSKWVRDLNVKSEPIYFSKKTWVNFQPSSWKALL